MKRKVLACFLIAAMFCTAAGCGGREEQKESSSMESVVETVILSQSEEVPQIDYSPKYEAFLDGSETVNAGAFPFMNPNVYDREELFFDGDGIYTLEDFILKVYEKEGAGYDNASIENVSYAYIDCGADGAPELALKATFLFDDFDLTEQYVIKGIGDEIQLTYMDRSYYRDVISIVNRYGKVVESGSIGYVMDLNRVGYLNADGQYDFCYDDYVSYAALYALDERFDIAVAESNENLDDLFLHAYCFETMGEATDYAEYLKTRWYTAEKFDDDISNGVNFKENARISQSLFDAAGVHLYTKAEVQDKMASRKQELGVSPLVDREDASVEWKDISLKDRWIEAARKVEYRLSPSPEAEFDLSYANEVPYDAAQLPDLADVGDADGEKIDRVVKLADSISGCDFYENGNMPDFFYGEGTVQTVSREVDDSYRIAAVDVHNGNLLMDDLMRSVGYGEYYVSYYYPFGAWADNLTDSTEPVMVKLNIDGNTFTYYFTDGQLIRRIDQNDAAKDNVKTNDFIKTIFKLGCYYGGVLNVERGRYMLMMTGNARVTETSDGYVLTTGVQGLSADYDFIIDERTDFFDRSACVAFDGYEPGDTPLRWLMRVSENQDDYPMALMGLFDIKTSGSHIDYFYGCYWWD